MSVVPLVPATVFSPYYVELREPFTRIAPSMLGHSSLVFHTILPNALVLLPPASRYYALPMMNRSAAGRIFLAVGDADAELLDRALRAEQHAHESLSAGYTAARDSRLIADDAWEEAGFPPERPIAVLEASTHGNVLVQGAVLRLG